jgi:hypothetical protein
MDDQKYLKQTNNNERNSLKDIDEQDAPWKTNPSGTTHQAFPAKRGKKEVNFSKILGKKTKIVSAKQNAGAYQDEETPELSEPEQKPQFLGLNIRTVNVKSPRIPSCNNINIIAKIDQISHTDTPSINISSSYDSDDPEPVRMSPKMITQKRQPSKARLSSNTYSIQDKRLTPSSSNTESNISEFVASPRIRNPRLKLDIGMTMLPWHNRAELPPLSNGANYFGEGAQISYRDRKFGVMTNHNWGEFTVNGSKELGDDVIDGIAGTFFDKYITMTKHIKEKYKGVFTYEAKKHMNDAISIEVRTYLEKDNEFMGI